MERNEKIVKISTIVFSVLLLAAIVWSQCRRSYSTVFVRQNYRVAVQNEQFAFTLYYISDIDDRRVVNDVVTIPQENGGKIIMSFAEDKYYDEGKQILTGAREFGLYRLHKVKVTGMVPEGLEEDITLWDLRFRYHESADKEYYLTYPGKITLILSGKSEDEPEITFQTEKDVRTYVKQYKEYTKEERAEENNEYQ